MENYFHDLYVNSEHFPLFQCFWLFWKMYLRITWNGWPIRYHEKLCIYQVLIFQLTDKNFRTFSEIDIKCCCFLFLFFLLQSWLFNFFYYFSCYKSYYLLKINLQSFLVWNMKNLFNSLVPNVHKRVKNISLINRSS